MFPRRLCWQYRVALRSQNGKISKRLLSSATSSLAKHEEAVEAISNKIKSFYETSTPFRIYHGSTNSTRNVKFDPARVVDTSALTHVLSVDKTTQTAIVESNVPMDGLVAATLPYGLIPPVVPEFPGITVGGSFSGTAGESSSFKHGYFDRTINWCDIVLADGTVMRASATENSDLFRGAIGAFGTLGVLTRFEIQLQPALPYVEVTYNPTRSIAHAMACLKEQYNQPHDFVDGILFSRHKGAIITGRLVSSPSSATGPTPQRFMRAQDPWFYLHAKDAASSKEPRTDIVPLTDYLFRYDRGAFWMGSYAYDRQWLPFNRATRFLLDPLMHTRELYSVLHHSGQAQRFIIQDLALPSEAAEEFVNWVDWAHGIYPLWLCPIRADPLGPLQIGTNSPRTDMLINVGVWGEGKGYQEGGGFEAFKRDNREIEARVRDCGGVKWLYAHTYYTEAEFWDIYNRSAYDALRSKYHAESLPRIDEKVRAKDEEIPMSEYKGAFLAALGKNYLMRR